MAYFEPYVDNSGMHIPTYTDIRDDLIGKMKNIFGQDIYIDEDSADYQHISIFAKKIYDMFSVALVSYNNRTPVTSVGVGLDNICALAGITRKPGSYSTVQLVITGNPSSVIENGVASDGTNRWVLPVKVVIPNSGTITVEATCERKGNITALPNSINIIETPTYGWYSVTNNYSASSGTDEETDAKLRKRFAISTSSPASCVFDSMQAALLAVPDVTKIKCYENDTSETVGSFPPHSITCIVEGGDNEEVATAIYYIKTPGCYTNGTTAVPLLSENGNITTIRFSRPVTKDVYAEIDVTPLSGYSTNTSDEIVEAVTKYINELEIGSSIPWTSILTVSLTELVGAQNPTFTVSTVKLGFSADALSTQNLQLDYNGVANAASVVVKLNG